MEFVEIKISIQPGHKSSKTTGIYTHVSDVNMRNIKNPLDNILQKGAEPNAKDK